jgi:hypothetical protein
VFFYRIRLGTLCTKVVYTLYSNIILLNFSKTIHCKLKQRLQVLPHISSTVLNVDIPVFWDVMPYTLIYVYSNSPKYQQTLDSTAPHNTK